MMMKVKFMATRISLRESDSPVEDWSSYSERFDFFLKAIGTKLSALLCSVSTIQADLKSLLT